MYLKWIYKYRQADVVNCIVSSGISETAHGGRQIFYTDTTRPGNLSTYKPYRVSILATLGCSHEGGGDTYTASYALYAEHMILTQSCVASYVNGSGKMSS